jgi:uncharacterized protein (DUF2384 family)
MKSSLMKSKEKKSQYEKIQRVKTVDKIVFYVNDCFEHDQQKVYGWFTTPNPNFGEVTPYDMIQLGREERVLNFIEEQYTLSGRTLIQ